MKNVFAWLVLVFVLVFGGVWFFQFCWNEAIVPTFDWGIHTITYWQTFGLLFVLTVLKRGLEVTIKK